MLTINYQFSVIISSLLLEHLCEHRLATVRGVAMKNLLFGCSVDDFEHLGEHLFCLGDFSALCEIFELLGEGLELRLKRLTAHAALFGLLGALDGGLNERHDEKRK